MTVGLTPGSTARTVRLPRSDGSVRSHRVGSRSGVHDEVIGLPPARTRRAFAAAHVVIDPLGTEAAAPSAAVDWDATLAFRHHLWSMGLGVADAMDTAQRNGGLDWPTARELIARSGREARAVGGHLVCGAMTDQLLPGARYTLDNIAAAYLEQAQWIVEHGATPVLMASRHLAAAARTADDYRTVYGRVLAELDGPVMLHWLGEAFDPAMRGYWGAAHIPTASDTFLDILATHRDKLTGVKVSLLDADFETALRRRLPQPVAMFTGDDFNYADLIAGDGESVSHALLGAFDVIAAPARAALGALDHHDNAAYRRILDPTVPLSRHLFTAPTSAYKTGVVFLAWLNGHQRHFHMLGGAQSARSVVHLSAAFALADRAGCLADPELAVRRMRSFLAVAGVDA